MRRGTRPVGRGAMGRVYRRGRGVDDATRHKRQPCETKPIPQGREGRGLGDEDQGVLHKQTQSQTPSGEAECHREQTKPIYRDVARGTQDGGRVQTKPISQRTWHGHPFGSALRAGFARECRLWALALMPPGSGPGANRAKQSQFGSARAASRGRLCKTNPICYPRTGKTIAEARGPDDATRDGGNCAKANCRWKDSPEVVTSGPRCGTKDSRGRIADWRVAQPD